jgi:protein-S-isoprenylcysteine O-methyltransferase Ste14
MRLPFREGGEERLPVMGHLLFSLTHSLMVGENIKSFIRKRFGENKLVRHPLYLFSLLVIWSFATMSQAMFAFNIAATLYFIFGSLLEEQRLLAIFGQSYVDYQQHVPWLIPFLKIKGDSHSSPN